MILMSQLLFSAKTMSETYFLYQSRALALVWKFTEFNVGQNLREIDMAKEELLTILNTLNFHLEVICN